MHFQESEQSDIANHTLNICDYLLCVCCVHRRRNAPGDRCFYGMDLLPVLRHEAPVGCVGKIVHEKIQSGKIPIDTATETEPPHKPSGGS